MSLLTRPWHRRIIVGIIVLGGALPVALYWPLVGRVPGVSPEKARERLGSAEGTAVLVDVRATEEHETGHIDGAVTWPYDEVMAVTSPGGVPRELQGKSLLLVCNSGILSAVATRKLRDAGVASVWNVEGGMQAWVASGETPCGLSFCRMKDASGTTDALPFRASPLYEQWIAVISGFGIKPTYMLLSLILAALLWRRCEADLVALRWSLLFFFAGEAFCAVNYAVYHDGSYLAEYLHSYGMVLGFGFTSYALFEGMDARMLNYTDRAQKCAALRLCRSCIKYQDIGCGLQRLFLFLIPATGLVALMPLCAEPKAISYNTVILGTPYNYSHFVVHQLYETRLCPLLSILLLAVSLAILLLKKDNPVALAKLFFAAGMGPLAFGMFRLFLLAAYSTNLVWFVFWEEFTELLYIAGLGVTLWIFRGSLFRVPGETG